MLLRISSGSYDPSTQLTSVSVFWTRYKTLRGINVVRPLANRKSSSSTSCQSCSFARYIPYILVPNHRALVSGMPIQPLPEQVPILSWQPLISVLLTVVQDSTGRLATILFAWLASSALGTEPQKYRLLADLFNDLALLSDCMIPRLLHYRLPLLCFSGVSRALCGVIAGGVGATLTMHFAKRGNLADVSAKGHSLATVAQLMGTMVQSQLIRLI